MKSSIVAIAAAAGSAYAAQATAYGQCGGESWTGATTCVSGYTCTYQNDWYSQCVPGTASSTLATKASTSAKATIAATTKAATSTKATVAPTTKAATPATSSKVTSTVVVSSSKAVVTSSSKAAATSAASKTSSSAASSTGKVKYAGVNISGFDFGCSTDGTCTTSGIVDPGDTGIAQMKHFVTDSGLNAFRLPVGWQYLTNNVLGGTLNAANFAAYDNQMQTCLSIADLCIIDLHNYARWNGNIVGQSSGSVTDAHLSSLWSQLATKYAADTKVAFGIMNEPHDLTSVTTWATTVQASVSAIRQAGATSQIILLPGNDWTHASSSISDGSAAALATVVNLDKSTTNLVYDVHQYLDSDGSGQSTSCSTNNVDTFTTLGAWLRTNGRQAMLTETGGGASDSSCLTDVCAQLQVLMEYSDVYLGWTGWAAGMFATSYALSETPLGSAGSYTDQELVTQCIAGIFKSG